MLTALEALRDEFSFEIDVVDVDADPELERKYNELVPVVAADGLEICHYFFDTAKVREYLGRFR